MPNIRDRLNAMAIQVLTPDGNVLCKLTGKNAFDLKFRSDSFYNYRAASLNRQLSAAITQLYVSYGEERRGILMEAGFSFYDPEKPHWNKRTREFNSKRDGLTYEGRSLSGSVLVTSSGWRQFNVSIDDSSLEQMETDDFVAEVKEAMADLYIDHRIAERMIKREVYGYKNGY